MSRYFMRDLVWRPFTSGFGWPFPKVTGDPLDESLEFIVVDEDWGCPADGSGIQPPRELAHMAEALVDGAEPDEPEPEVWIPYSYSQLGRSENYIRILELLPGNPNDELYCNLRIHKLDNCPEFEALSYCWGDDKDKTPINVEKGILAVTMNLYHALLHLRRKSKPRLLWIDAVCINQQDLDERTRQVQLMRHIYRQATRTVVWLGLASDESGLAFLTCFKLARDGGLAQREMNSQHSHLQAIESSVKGTVITDREREAIVNLVQRTWFQRIWVVQEVGVAKDAIVVCGWREIHWDTLSLGINYGLFIDQLNVAQLGVVTAPDFVNFTAIATINFRESDRLPAEQLLDLLMKFRTRDAKDPRDKVFSLLGLVEGELGLIPNYSSDCTAVNVYTQTTAAIILGSGNLDILGLCPTALKSDLATVLPSWATDWSFTKFLPKPFTIETTDRKRTTHSSRCTKALPEFIDKDSVLVISGHTVDFISELGDVLHDIVDNGFFEEETVADANSAVEEDGFRGAWEELKSAANIGFYVTSEILGIVTHLEIFMRWEKLARINKKSAVPTPSREDDTAVYWQTLCAGCMPEGYSTTQKQYQEWYNSLSAVRRLVKLRVNKLPSLFKPLAFAGYVNSTWESYGKFGSLMQHANGRRLARTKRGFLCLVPAGSQVNDPIVLCAGGKVPLIARVQDGYWRFVGESYVHGLMDGEAFDPDACEKMLFK